MASKPQSLPSEIVLPQSTTTSNLSPKQHLDWRPHTQPPKPMGEGHFHSNHRTQKWQTSWRYHQNIPLVSDHTQWAICPFRDYLNKITWSKLSGVQESLHKPQKRLSQLNRDGLLNAHPKTDRPGRQLKDTPWTCLETSLKRLRLQKPQ